MKKNKNRENGQSLELYYSLKLKEKNIPVLISSKVLRVRSLGQIDLCFIDKKSDLGIIYEIKSGQKLYDESWVSKKQLARLYRSADWLSQVLNKSFIVKVI